ncbi:MAG: ROK family protein [Candidatus Pacebacteria bacterium]|nr:ROK family protein [Candidatus Paceibacterota bacterium]
MYKIGIDLGGTKIAAVILDSQGQQLWEKRIATPQNDYGQLISAFRDLVASADQFTKPVIASIGIGIPGAIDSVSQRIKNSNLTLINGTTLDRDLRQAIGRDIRIGNDANCLATSEATDGAAKGAGLVFAIIIGTGTGGGIALHGQQHIGPNAIGGEWGHNPLPWPDAGIELPGPPCYCGKFGCIETWISGTGLAKDHLRVSGLSLRGEQIVAAAAAGEPEAEASLQRFENRFARATATIINSLDPDVIVVGGGLSRLERLYVNIPKLWPQFVFSPQIVTPFLPALHGDASGVRGAAHLWP